MPGSLLLSNDAYSDLSEISGRSLDSRASPKKVSFNNAVRVKQYPWKPEVESKNGEHLTLPSNRFWFKVYKNKQDASISHDSPAEISRKNAWGDDTADSIHDSLAPIAEDEDQEYEPNNLGSNIIGREYLPHNFQASQCYTTSKDPFPAEPPIDYFDEMHLDSDRSYYSPTSSRRNGNVNYTPSTAKIPNRTAYSKRYDMVPELDEDELDNRFNTTSNLERNGRQLPRIAFQNDSPLRRSVRRSEDVLKKRERRSRSHDDHLDNGSRFKLLKKADKSVSTEDLKGSHENGIISNKFLKGSRDMSTQCYGTLTRTNISDFGTLNSPSFVLRSEAERLNNFKSQRSPRMTSEKNSHVSAKSTPIGKDKQSEFIHRILPYQSYQASKNLEAGEKNTDFKKYGSYFNSKMGNQLTKDVTREENYSSHSTQNGKRIQNTRTVGQTISSVHNNINKTAKDREIPNRDSATIGYLRGRQIPLSEVNTNTNRRFTSGSEMGIHRNSFSLRKNDNAPGVGSPKSLGKTELHLSNGLRSKRYPTSNLENNNGKSFRTDYRSSKFHSPKKHENDSSMIDWSLSGFQLATKPDNGRTSMSDSEYTVHRREPLLMYIPGISHHEHPAIEDDRLSALSDVSRSDFSSLGTKGKISPSEGRRRYTDGRLNWMQRKNKG